MDCRERSRRRVQQLRDLINAIGVRRQEFDVESAVGVLFEQAADEVQIVEDGGVDDDQFATGDCRDIGDAGRVRRRRLLGEHDGVLSRLRIEVLDLNRRVWQPIKQESIFESFQQETLSRPNWGVEPNIENRSKDEARRGKWRVRKTAGSASRGATRLRSSVAPRLSRVAKGVRV